jgi:hypothetical protein
MTVARPRVGPPPLAVPPYRDVSPSILAFASGAGRAMGMAAGPGAPNPTADGPDEHGVRCG